jgi:hypothetical protein
VRRPSNKGATSETQGPMDPFVWTRPTTASGPARRTDVSSFEPLRKLECSSAVRSFAAVLAGKPGDPMREGEAPLAAGVADDRGRVPLEAQQVAELEDGGEAPEPEEVIAGGDVRAIPELLDPAVRQAAQLGPPQAALAAEPSAQGSRVPASLEELLPRLVKRVAWAGDKRRGTMVLELGAGRHAGTTIAVHAEEGRLRIEVGGSPDAEELRARIGARLRRQGLDVESVT